MQFLDAPTVAARLATAPLMEALSAMFAEVEALAARREPMLVPITVIPCPPF